MESVRTRRFIGYILILLGAIGLIFYLVNGRDLVAMIAPGSTLLAGLGLLLGSLSSRK